MGQKYTQIPVDTMQKLQMNAGVFCRDFNPATGEVTGLLGATTGGGSFNAAPEYLDFGDDIDNCPKNMMELKRIDDITVTLSTTFLTIDPAMAKLMMGAADIDGSDATHIVPRNNLLDEDFTDIWWVGDYSNKNTGSGAGFCAIHLMNALATGGFQIQSTDKGKGQFSVELTGHYSIDAQDTVPYEVYIKAGTSSGDTPEILLEKHAVTIKVGDKVNLTVARKYPASASVTWSSSTTAKATVSNGEVTGVAAGSTIITASITDSGVTYSDTCTVVVEAAS